MELQGGTFSAKQASQFIGQENAAEAVQLRLWNDQAKSADLVAPPLAYYLARARRRLVH